MSFQGSYLNLLKEGSLQARVEELKRHIEQCSLCPHNCLVNRQSELGFCQAGEQTIVSAYSPHFGEEDILVGRKGSGAIFFGYCNMRCVYCQNYSLSFHGKGRPVSETQLADMMLRLQNDYGCHNINLVSPTHFTANIVEALYVAARRGLVLPIVYNCGGYESVENLRLLEGLVDIYMPDFKYFSNETGKTYSEVDNYLDIVREALIEMDRQVGGIKTRGSIAYRGLLIRHLMLPGRLEETKQILKFISAELSEGVVVNLMSQYYPSNLAHEYPPLNRRLGPLEYREGLEYAKELGLRMA